MSHSIQKMKTKHLIIGTVALITAFAVQAQSFSVGKISYEVIDETNKMVQIAPAASGAYSNVSSSDLAATVSYNGTTYQVVGVGAGAFANSSISGTLALPEGIVYIDNQSFTATTGNGVSIPASVAFITETAFVANKLASFAVSSGNKDFTVLSTTQDNVAYTFLTNKAQTCIISAPGQTVKSSSWRTSYVSNITIPNQITEIGDNAFYQHPSLTSIKFHNGLKRIGNNVFFGTAITSVDLSMLPADCKYGINMFTECHSLTRVTMPTTMKIIPRGFVYCCDALKSITIPNGVEELGMQSFSNTALSSINLPESVTRLDSCALQMTPITTINLKNVKFIDNQAFSSCLSLTSITGGEKLETLAGTPFAGCTKLASMPFFPALKNIDGGPWFNCTALTALRLPAGMEYVKRNPAVGCSKITEYKVDEGEGNYVEFDSCIYELKNGKPYRLVGCPAGRLNKVLVLRPGTEILGEQAIREVPLTAIYGTPELKEIIVGGSAFKNTIMTVQMLAKVPPTGATKFNNDTYANGTLYVPKGSIEAYKAAEGWKNFKHIVGIDVPDDIKGDINGDGAVDVADLNLLINAVLGVVTIDNAVGDITGDNAIDIADINSLINIILGA